VAKAEPDDDDRDFDPPEPPEIRRSAAAVRIVFAVLGLIGVGIIGAFGGFERAGVTHDLPTVAKNETVDAGDWRFTVDDDAVAGPVLREVQPHNDGNYLIEVDVTMNNVSDRTKAVYGRVTIEAMDGLVDVEPRQHIMIRDNQLAAYLQPDLPERVAYIWEFKAGTPVPKELKVTLHGEYTRPVSFAILNSTITDDEKAASINLPVTNRTGT
jgi:hypothetical protein